MPDRLPLQRVVIRFAGDSGDGMQLTGDRFTAETAIFGNDIATLPNFPAEIRAPQGTLPGVSSFQLHWAPSDGATGYNVRYGIAPEKLYSSFLVYENSNVILSSLTKGQTYYAAVDAFNESGITEGKTVKL